MSSYEELKGKFQATVRNGDDYQTSWTELCSSQGPITVTIARREPDLELSGGEGIESMRIESGHLSKVHLKSMAIKNLKIVCPKLTLLFLEDVEIAESLVIQVPADGLENLEISNTKPSREFAVNRLNLQPFSDQPNKGHVGHLTTKNIKIIDIKSDINSIDYFSASNCHFVFSSDWTKIINLTTTLAFDKTTLVNAWRFDGNLTRAIEITDSIVTGQLTIKANRLKKLAIGIKSDDLIEINELGKLDELPNICVQKIEKSGPVLHINSADTIVSIQPVGQIKKIQFRATSNLRAHTVEIKSAAATVDQLDIDDGYQVENFCISGLEVKNLRMGKVEYSERFELSNSKVHSVKMVGTIFKGAVTFDGVQFVEPPHIKTKSPFEFYQVSFSGCTFTNRSYESQSHYRKLRHLMAEIGNEPDEQFFGSLELICRTKKFWNHPSETFFGCLYNLLNECGQSLMRPLLWLLFFAFAFAAFDIAFNLGWSLNITAANPYLEIAKKAQTWPHLCQAVFRSVNNSLGALRLATPPVFYPTGTLATFTQLFQILLSTILWFFFIVGIRRRFKLK